MNKFKAILNTKSFIISFLLITTLCGNSNAVNWNLGEKKIKTVDYVVIDGLTIEYLILKKNWGFTETEEGKMIRLSFSTNPIYKNYRSNDKACYELECKALLVVRGGNLREIKYFVEGEHFFFSIEKGNFFKILPSDKVLYELITSISRGNKLVFGFPSFGTSSKGKYEFSLNGSSDLLRNTQKLKNYVK